MSTPSSLKHNPMLIQVLDYIKTTTGLTVEFSTGVVVVKQKVDSHQVVFESEEIVEVLSRIDNDNKPFLQVNFRGDRKILVTDNLIGFKPVPVYGLDISKLPKVVTTPDITNVATAIEESLNDDRANFEEVDLLKKVYSSIVMGGEQVGFNLDEEKNWVKRINTTFLASA